MTTTAKVLAFLNILLIFVYGLFAASIVDYRQRMQKNIKNETTNADSMIGRVQDADKEVYLLHQGIRRLREQLTARRLNGRDRARELDAEIARLDDLINTREQQSSDWQTSVANVKEERDARQQETSDLEQEIADANRKGEDLVATNRDLTNRLDDARTELDRLMATEIPRKYREIRELAKQIRTSESEELADRRR